MARLSTILRLKRLNSLLGIYKRSPSCLQSIQTNYREYHHDHDRARENWWEISKNQRFLLLTAGAIGGTILTLSNDFGNASVEAAEKYDPDIEKHHKTVRTDLPTYRMEDVAAHNNEKTGIWVTYGIGVYDITEFVPKHPGSDKVMLGAGSAIDPFWHVFQQHNTPEVLTLLETFRIGNLNPEDQVSTRDMGDPWSGEPRRHPILKPAAQKPFNAEPPPSILIDSFITPNEFFYVRNHLPVPEIDEKTYELEIEIEGVKKVTKMTLKDLKKLPKHSVTAVVMCGGNRRSDMDNVKKVKGLYWGPSAVGNAVWTGVKLCDVLAKMGVKSDEEKHVHFEGLDTDPTSTYYAASIPLAKAMDPRGDVLLAYEMNGQPLSRDHGFPVRAIVPGTVGARNVKWLGKILISDKESDSHWQQKDYKGFSPSTDWDTVDFSKSPAIQHMPVTSAICYPSPGDKVKVEDGFITVKGYAWSGGGCRIVRVDLTCDGGETWHVAELEQEDLAKAPPGRAWSWTLWSAKIPVPKKAREVEIWSKAVDSNYNVQPESFKNTWNLRGVLSNAYSRVKVKLAK
ncbi:sulfite oxidase, mitochondrial isoform X1 [Phlebotomus papatasi]|uniref:sulfite oxidase, mitochondrial isoform X1 n=1 Tax=Phlebotomus papatasi TaxID=29031 RepID=UPI0024845BE6|nr:sulfite oxidase, mitochondrial isoform X1 [Phlebotomus papatasi]